MIKPTDSGPALAEISKFLKDFAKTTKVAVVCRAQRQAAVRQLKNFTLLHNFIGVIEVAAEFLCGGRGVNQTICYYFWSDASTCLTLGRRPFVSCQQCKTRVFNDVINFLDIRGKKNRRRRDCLEVLTFFFAVPGSAVEEVTVISGNPKKCGNVW